MVIAICLAGAALSVLFERSVVRLTELEINGDIEQLAANLALQPSGTVELVREPADPRFRRPLSGRYYQIMAGDRIVIRSRSLWDSKLVTPRLPLPPVGVVFGQLKGPESQRLHAGVRSVVLSPEDEGPDSVIGIVVATDRNDIEALKAEFRFDLLKALGLLAALLIVASFAQVVIGLRPLELLRQRLANVRLGQAPRLEGTFPSELLPLVNETNRLLDAQNRNITRAVSRAGDLAHGLKTPLTALSVMAQRIKQDGQTALAAGIEQHLSTIKIHVERELARARMQAGATAPHRTAVLPIVTRLVRTLQTLPRGDELEWLVDLDPEMTLALDEADFAEAIGNLLDNARKWARQTVTISGHQDEERLYLAVTDDGPGVPPSEFGTILRRGMRLDETKPGTGLGLSIVAEIAETYGGQFSLDPIQPGFSARLALPRLSLTSDKSERG